jgi:hypothetical protein
MYIAVVSILAFFYSFNVALGQEQPTNRSSSIVLSPIYTPGDTIMKSFEKEFGDMVRSIDQDDS